MWANLDRGQLLFLLLELLAVLLQGVGFALFLGHRELLLELAGVRLGGPLDIPDEANPLQKPKQVRRRVELAFEHPVVRRDRPGVVIVVVGLAPGQIGEDPTQFVSPEAIEPEIGADVLGVEIALAELVTARVHPIGDVIGEENPERAAIEEAAIPAEAGEVADDRRNEKPKPQPHKKRIAEEHDLLVFLELRVGVAVEEQAAQPADVSMPEAMNRAVQVLIGVGMNVMVMVVGEPIDHLALRGGRPEHEKESAQPRLGLIAWVGALPVEAERDAERAQLATDEREEERRAEVHRPARGRCGRMHGHIHDRRRDREQRGEDDEVGNELMK